MTEELSIENILERSIEQLRAQAGENNRSLQEEVLAILEESLTKQPLTPREVYLEVAKLGLTTPSEAVTIIRTERDVR